MAVVISNRGRLISDLTSVANLNNDDLFIIQSVNASTNSTRKATISQLSQKVLGSLSSYSTIVKFSSTGNEFTGAFYNANGNTSNLYDVTIRNSLSIGTGVTATISPTNLTFAPVNGALFTKKITNTIGGITGSASTGFTGSLKGKLTGPVTGNVTGNVVGNLTGNVAGNVTGNVAGNVTGNITGNVTGDIYSPTSMLVLDNGTGVPKSARFYGTSSFATWAENVVGGNTGINATQARSYVTTSMNSGGGVANTLPKFSGTSKLGLSSINDNGTSVSISTALTVATKISAGGISGSFYGGSGGYKTQGTKSVSFWGTGSHAVTASYVISTIPLENTSTATLSGFLGGTNEGGVGAYCYAITHGFGVTPSWIRSTLYCVTGDAGYVTGDEVDLNAIEQDELDANVFSTWTNSTYAAISVAGNTGFANNLYIPNKIGGTWTLIVPANWKYKIRVLK